MFFSKSDFFNETPSRLEELRNQVKAYLVIKRIDSAPFLDAFDFFVKNPEKFDGETIVKDLDDLPNLSLSGLKHDYDYIVELPKYNGYKWLIAKIKMDIQYGQNLEKLGKGIIIPYTRVFLLILSTPLYWIIKLF